MGERIFEDLPYKYELLDSSGLDNVSEFFSCVLFIS